MTTPAELIDLINKLIAEENQDATDANIESKGAAASARRANRVAVINKLKADIKSAAAKL